MCMPYDCKIDISDKLKEVYMHIHAVAEANGRLGQDVQLVAASKTVNAACIQQAIDAGQMIFGENRVQEAKSKWPALREKNPEVELHLIGPLQSNKARDAVRLFDVIQSIDRSSLARKVAGAIEKEGRSPRVLIQVNTGKEPQKGGALPEEVEALIREVRDDLHLNLVGLMCIPPVGLDTTQDFQLLKSIAEKHNLQVLSMGMSDDYEAAIRYGATHVRVGRAIFGARM